MPKKFSGSLSQVFDWCDEMPEVSNGFDVASPSTVTLRGLSICACVLVQNNIAVIIMEM